METTRECQQESRPYRLKARFQPKGHLYVLMEEMKTRHILCLAGQHLAASVGTFAICTGIPIALLHRHTDQSGYLQSGDEYAEMNMFMTYVAIVIMSGLICFASGGIAIGVQFLRHRIAFSRWLPLLIIALAVITLFIVKETSIPDTAQALMQLIWGCIALAMYWLLLLGFGYGTKEKNQNKNLEHISDSANAV